MNRDPEVILPGSARSQLAVRFRMGVGGFSDDRSAERFERGHVAAAGSAMQHPAQAWELFVGVAHFDAEAAVLV